MRVGIITLATAMILSAAGSANATACAAQPVGYGAPEPDIYGFILNTDGGTFDGVALVAAVQASAEVAFLARMPGQGIVRAGLTEE